MKIGILFPLSGQYPNIGFDFMAGLKAQFQLHDLTEKVEILKEAIGYGGVEKEVYAKAEKLLISDDVDVLIGYVDQKVLPILYPLLQATQKLMLVVNPGANIPENWIPQPTVLHLNLQHAFLCWMTGAKAAASGNGQAALATTFYDCGYLHSALMVNNFVQQGGGIQYNYINNQQKDQPFNIDQVTGFLADNPGCKNMLCVFDELPANNFYRLLNQNENSSNRTLFVSPMMLQQKALGKLNESYFFDIDGFLPWRHFIDDEPNILFNEAVKTRNSIFGLLGWEAAIILTHLMAGEEVDLEDGVLQMERLIGREINSPRGLLKLDEETNHFLAPVHHFSLEKGSVDPVISLVKNLESQWKTFIDQPTDGIVSGWTNTYLCY